MSMLVTVTVGSFDEFLAAFTSRGLVLRERHGSRGVQVLRHAADPDRVSLLFDWDAEDFARFLADPEVQESMRASGAQGPPEVVELEDAVRLEA